MCRAISGTRCLDGKRELLRFHHTTKCMGTSAAPVVCHNSSYIALIGNCCEGSKLKSCMSSNAYTLSSKEQAERKFPLSRVFREPTHTVERHLVLLRCYVTWKAKSPSYLIELAV